MVRWWKTQVQWKSPYLLWINPLPPGSRLSVGGEQSYCPLLLGPGCSFGLGMGKRIFLGLCEGAFQGAMGSASLDGSMWYFRGSWVVGAVQRNCPLCPGPRGHGSGLERGIALQRHCWHLCKPRVRGPRVSHQNWDSWQSSFLCRLCEMHTIPQSLQAQLQTKQRWQEWHSLANYSVVPSVYLVLCHQLQPAFF